MSSPAPFITNKKISVIVPCYRDEPNIEEMLTRLTKVFTKISPNYEIIYVNDASPGNAEEILASMVKKFPNVTVIHHARNFGLMNVFYTGLKHCSGDAAIVMDGDLQDPPEVIEAFVTKWLDGYDVVFGVRAKRKEKLLRKIGYYFFYRLWRLLANVPITPDAGDFSLIDRKVVKVFLELPEKDRFFRGLRSWMGFKQTSVSYERPQRFAGDTTQSLNSYFGWALLAITSFSYFPLRLISIIAVAFSFVLAFFLFVNVTLFFFDVKGPRGFLTIIGVVLLSSSLILFCLSVIAEYLIRIYIEVKARPNAVVKEIIHGSVEFK